MSGSWGSWICKYWTLILTFVTLISRTNGYTCNDGCVISDDWVNDDICDCSDCGDECGWSCSTCTCPTSCGNYTHCSGSGIPCSNTTNTYTVETTTITRTTQSSYDYYYDPSYSYDSTDTEYLSCTYAGCSVEKTWYISGRCLNPELRVSMIETDFATSSTEYAYVYVNDVWIDTCSELNEDCTDDWVQCSGAYDYDLSDDLYLPYSYSDDSITIKLSVSSDVNYCFYSSIYPLYAEVEIVCNNGDADSSTSDNDDDDDSGSTWWIYLLIGIFLFLCWAWKRNRQQQAKVRQSAAKPSIVSAIAVEDKKNGLAGAGGTSGGEKEGAPTNNSHGLGLSSGHDHEAVRTRSPSDSYKNDLWGGAGGAGTGTAGSVNIAAAYSTPGEAAPVAAYDFNSRPAESNMFNNANVGEGVDMQMVATPGEDNIGSSGYEADYNINDIATGGNNDFSGHNEDNDNPFDKLVNEAPIVPPADINNDGFNDGAGDGVLPTSGGNGMTTAGGPSTYVVPGYEDDYDDGYEDVYGRRDTVSVVGNGSGGNVNSNINTNINNWDSWNQQQVLSWVENKLLNELNFDKKEVSEFMKSFIKEGINGDKLRKFKEDDNNRFVNDLQSRLDNAFLASLYTDVQMAVMELP